jgi:predicted nucleic acid-binding protein
VIAYVESNFILELALEQEEAATAEAILLGAEQRLLELVIPAFALSEPFSTMSHRSRERKRLGNQLEEQFRQLRRSNRHATTIQPVEKTPVVLLGLEKAESDALDLVITRSLQSASRIDLTSDIFTRAIEYRRDYDLSTPDAIIYAAVIADAQKRNLGVSKLFISLNSKDFDIPQIRNELASLGAHYCESFAEGVNKLEQHGIKLPRLLTPPSSGVP